MRFIYLLLILKFSLSLHLREVVEGKYYVESSSGSFDQYQSSDLFCLVYQINLN